MNFTVFKDWKEYGIFGAIGGAAAWLVAQAVSKIPNINISFATIDVRSKLVGGLGTGLGDKIFGLIGGITVPNIFVMLLSGIVVAFLGGIIASLWTPFKKPIGQWTWILFTGSLAGMLILTKSFTSIFSLATIALLVYSFVLAAVLTFAADNIGWMKNNMPRLPA